MLKVSKAEFTHKCEWLLFRKSARFVLEITPVSGEIDVSGVATAILKNFPFPSISEHLQKRREDLPTNNWRGRSTCTNVDSGHPSIEELLFISGQLFSPPTLKDALPIDINKLTQNNFTYKLNTSFKEFLNNGDITYQVSRHTSANIHTLKEKIKPLRFLNLLPSKVLEVRFGVEFFNKNFWGSLIGNTPLINSHYFLNITTKAIALDIEETLVQKRHPQINLAIESLDKSLSDFGLKEKCYNLIPAT